MPGQLAFCTYSHTGSNMSAYHTHTSDKEFRLQILYSRQARETRTDAHIQYNNEQLERSQHLRNQLLSLCVVVVD